MDFSSEIFRKIESVSKTTDYPENPFINKRITYWARDVGLIYQEDDYNNGEYVEKMSIVDYKINN